MPANRRYSTHRAFPYSIDDKLTVPPRPFLPLLGWGACLIRRRRRPARSTAGNGR
jgi:hypothetical protein